MKTGLFVPCYVNSVYPEAGVATYKLLAYFGLDVEYPHKQTCCGQPAANGGFEKSVTPLAEKFEKLFGDYDRIVAPSASCVAFVKSKYAELLHGRECRTETKIYELCEFLHDVLKVKNIPGKFSGKVSLHNSCHGVRELRLSSASELNVERYSKIKTLLSMVDGLELFEPVNPDECCGFGGMFSVEEPDVSACMGRDKLAAHLATGADYIAGADSSCLMHLQGIARREKLPVKFIHVSQILASGL